MLDPHVRATLKPDSKVSMHSLTGMSAHMLQKYDSTSKIAFIMCGSESTVQRLNSSAFHQAVHDLVHLNQIVPCSPRRLCIC